MVLVDTHAHLDMEDLRRQLPEVLKRARDNGICAIVTIGIDYDSSREALEIARENPMVYATIGVHPHNAKDLKKDDFIKIKELANERKVVAYGEIGLDFFKNFSPKDIQLKVFEEQLDLVEELGLPVVIHERNAQDEVYSILKSRNSKLNRGIIHCFSGNVDIAKRFIELGFLISIPGIVTFKKAETLRQVVKEIPLDSILLETDAPFLAPEPYRGKTNEPSYILWTAKAVANLRGISLDELAHITTENAKKIFNIEVLP